MEERVKIYDRFAEMWRSSREDAGVSQDYMARAMGVSKKTVQNWEAGTSCPNQATGFEWFSVLGLNPFPYYLRIVYPSFQKADAIPDNLDAALISMIGNLPTEYKMKLMYFLSGEHGSSPIALMDMMAAHLQTPLRDRINIAISVSTNYKLAQIRDTLTCDVQDVQPDMDLLNYAVDQGVKAVADGKKAYSATIGTQEVNL